VQVQLCAPHHPQQNGFVERYHRTYQEECLALDQPRSLQQAREVTAAFLQHYNFQRPNQALTCDNVPPRRAFPELPTLPPVPSMVDPDAWLNQLDGLHLERKVDRNGSVSLDLKRSSVSTRLSGQRVTLRLDAATRTVQVFQEQTLLKTVPLKGLVGKLMPYAQFLHSMCQQARAQHRLRSLQERRWRSATPPRSRATMF
jgi:hypothetical protein